ncbi:TPA: hypothetical protein N2A34_003137 [Pseudomonas aeruginosa]|nr:hypothetical protein [Pseudomonas aeruginosa]
MFESHVVARMHLGSTPPDAYEWSYLVLPEDLPWFQITWCHQPKISNERGGAEQRFIGYVPMLVGHLNADDDEHFVSEVLLVSPAWLNKSERTQMEPLTKLISYVPFEGSIPQIAYEVEGGKRYPMDLAWESLTSIELLFERKQLGTW